MVKKLLFVLISMILSVKSFAYEAPTGWATITNIYAADVVRFQVSGATLCGTSVFAIDSADKGSKEAYALILYAAATGKKVWVETWAACSSYSDYSKNWGMKVGSIGIQYP